jgi:hypothetical protein
VIRTRLTTWFLIAILLQLFAGTAFSQTTIPGTWPCADDAGDGIPQAMPPADYTIARDTAYQAPQGSLFEVALARGGTTGMYIFGHFHGIHNDRAGYSDFYGQALVQDQSGYTYAMLPPLYAKVTGKLTKPQKHQHCGAQFPVPHNIVNELNDSIKNGGKIQLVVTLGRERVNVGEQLARHFAVPFGDLAVPFRSETVARIDSIAAVLDKDAKEASAQAGPNVEAESRSTSDYAQRLRELANKVRNAPPQETSSMLDAASVPSHIANVLDPLRGASTTSVMELVANGTASVDFPGVAAILGDNGSRGLASYCTGILVASDTVLTAAHCVVGKHSKIPQKVYLHHAGTYEVVAANPDVDPEYDVSADPSNPYADLALIFLKHSVVGIIPASLNDVAIAPNTSGIIIGYGWHSLANPTGPSDLLDPRPGIKVYAKVFTTPCTGSNADSFVCWTFDPSFSPLSGSTCRGDSGGPFITEVAGQWRLAGITSVIFPTHPTPCQPGDKSVDVDVFHFLPWINKELGKHSGSPPEGRDHYAPGLQAFTDSVTTPILPVRFRRFGAALTDVPSWPMPVFEMPADFTSMRVALNATESDATLHLKVVQTNGSYVCAQDNDDTAEVCDVPAPKRGSKWLISVTGIPLQEYQIVVDAFSKRVP